MKKFYYTLLGFITSIAFPSCSENDGVLNGSFAPQTYDVQGKVEKGPFVCGSEINIQPMDAMLQVLGCLYNTSITDDSGLFILGNKEFPTPYAEFFANGYFFNEVKGTLSDGPITLRAVADLRDRATVNVNVLTHLKYARIKKLVTSGKRFEEANAQAQEELLKAFGLSVLKEKEVSSFSIIAGTEESAALIAISSLLLMERGEAALTEHLARLSADFGSNGFFSENIQQQLTSDKYKLAKYMPDIKQHVIERYNDLGIAVHVNDLSYYIDWDNDGTAGNELLKENEKIHVEEAAVDFPNEGGERTIQINAPIKCYLQPQVETDGNSHLEPGHQITEEVFFAGLYEGESSFADEEISFECKLEGDKLYITVAALQSQKEKRKTIPLYDYTGNVVATVELRQEGKAGSTSVTETPLLGHDAANIVSAMARELAMGLRDFNLLEQYYCYNKETGMATNNVRPDSPKTAAAWSSLYKANNHLLNLKKADAERLNVYPDYCNVLSALLYSNLVYGWGAVPYYKEYNSIENAIQQGGISKASPSSIFDRLKSDLSAAIDRLEEKRNEPLKDANGCFFASKDVARVLLANIHMYEGNYKDAEPLLKKVIDNGFYTLDASTDFQPSITTDYNVPAPTESTEIIFALRNEVTTRAGITIKEAGCIPYVTLSDVHLSLAECHYMLGDSISAGQHIQSVMEVKGLHSTGGDILTKIMEIRKQVLLYGGTYFAFLKRTGLAQEVCGIPPYRLLLPIPDQEMLTNRFMTQNPGY